MSVYIIGISAFFHDSAAAILCDGEVIAAAQEERFSRIKHDAQFPSNAIRYCLAESGIELSDVQFVVFYEKTLIKFERLLETYLSTAPNGMRSYLSAMPSWLKTKLLIKTNLRKLLADISGLTSPQLPKILFSEHHKSHAASAFYPSPFEESAILCIDGVGEWNTATIWHGQDNNLKLLKSISFPHSLGLLYSAFTHYTGFRVNSGEYKMMGLAPYGKPKYVDLIYSHLLHVQKDGGFRLNMEYFSFATGKTMTNRKFHRLFSGLPREPESEIRQRDMDLARSIQVVIEETVLSITKYVSALLPSTPNLCLAGGVALNSTSNGNLLKSGVFDNVWVQPAAGDAGGALGAAFSVWYEYLAQKRVPSTNTLHGMSLGPHFSENEIMSSLDDLEAVYHVLDEDFLIDHISDKLNEQKVIGWFQGRMEFGPRALGNRSILGDPRSATMQTTINMKIKYRESFRPFAPAITLENVSKWFDINQPSPYMSFVAQVCESKRLEPTKSMENLCGLNKIKILRSEIQAVTHVDYSSRIQTVERGAKNKFWALLKAFEEKTGIPILVNTSLNVRGEPIACTPVEAYNCFMNTEMDYLVMENILLAKSEQPVSNKPGGSKQQDVWVVHNSLNKHQIVQKKECRIFGIMLASFVLLFFAILYPWMTGATTTVWGIFLAGIMLVITLWIPLFLLPLLKPWILIGKVMAAINSRIILTLVWITIFVPTGLIWKLLRKDPLQKKAFTYKKNCQYWTNEDTEQKTEFERMF